MQGVLLDIVPFVFIATPFVERTAAMFLQKLTKSYSNSLPVYEPIPSDGFSPHAVDHDTGSFTCTYSPQHSVGVARVVVQSAQLRKPRGLKKWFRMKPSVWVKVKILGRTKGTISGWSTKEGEGGEVQSWREERVVGQTSVCNRTYNPNFGFKSYYTLLGPYEKQLELEVRKKRRWLWPFSSGHSSGSTVGIANFLLPQSPSHTEPPPPGSSTTQLREPESSTTRTSQSTVISNSQSPQDFAVDTNEWTVQAPLFNGDMSKIEGYLLFNVFWYPVVPAPLPVPISEPMYRPLIELEGQTGVSREVSPPSEAPGIATFTLHSLEGLGLPPGYQLMATVSLGWHLPALHTSQADTGSGQMAGSGPSESTESVGRLPGPSETTPQHSDRTTFDSTFEFLCLDAYSTNVVVKVYEVSRGNMMLDLGRKRKELVGHTSVPLLDLVSRQQNADVGSELDVGEVGSIPGDGDFGMSFDLRSTLERRRRGENADSRDRLLPLLGHPSAKARVCVEWRSLQIPGV